MCNAASFGGSAESTKLDQRWALSGRWFVIVASKAEGSVGDGGRVLSRASSIRNDGIRTSDGKGWKGAAEGQWLPPSQ
jgi:hypothetical protein